MLHRVPSGRRAAFRCRRNLFQGGKKSRFWSHHVSSVPFGVLYRFPSLLLQYYGLFLVPGCNTTNKFTALDRASIFSRVSSTRCYLSSAFFFFFFLERTKKHLRLQSQRSGTRCRDGALAYEVITDRMFFPLAAFLFRFVLVGWMRKTAALSC